MWPFWSTYPHCWSSSSSSASSSSSLSPYVRIVLRPIHTCAEYTLCHTKYRTHQCEHKLQSEVVLWVPSKRSVHIHISTYISSEYRRKKRVFFSSLCSQKAIHLQQKVYVELRKIQISHYQRVFKSYLRSNSERVKICNIHFDTHRRVHQKLESHFWNWLI